MQLQNVFPVIAAAVQLGLAAPLDNVGPDALGKRHGGGRPGWHGQPQWTAQSTVVSSTAPVAGAYESTGAVPTSTATLTSAGGGPSDSSDGSIAEPSIVVNSPSDSSQTSVVSEPSVVSDPGVVQAAAVTQPSVAGAYTEAGETDDVPTSTQSSVIIQATEVTTPSDSAGAVNQGEGTVYDQFSTEGACGAVNPDDAMIAAVSLSDYADKSLCGQKVRVTNTGPLPLPFDQQVTGEGNQIEVTIVDLCEGCKRTDIDLSRGAWSDLTDGYGDSRTSVSWEPI